MKFPSLRRRQYDFTIKGAKVFAACNESSRLSKPLQSRFRCLHLARHSEEQFLEVSAKVLPNLKIAHVIGRAARDQRGDIRGVISRKLVRKSDGPEEVEQILRTVAENNKNSSMVSRCHDMRNAIYLIPALIAVVFTP